MKIRLSIRRSIVLASLLFLCVLVYGGCTDTTGSAGAVAVFDGNSRCRYCNEKITDDDIDTMKEEHGNGICAEEIDFVDSSTHLCNFCGKPYVYNAQNQHGKDVCVYSCAGTTGHRVPTTGNHSPCEICDKWLCVGDHGEGICSTSISDKSSPGGMTAVLVADTTLRTFTATFPNGTVIDMRTVAARKNIIVTDQESVTVTAIASSSKATVSGDKGTLKLSPGENRFRVTVTSDNGVGAYFNFTITVNTPLPTPEPVPDPTPTPEPEPTPTPHSHSYVWQCDEEIHWQECDCGSTTEADAHAFGSDYITECVQCATCGYLYHWYRTEYNETHHWSVCSHGNIIDKAEHSLYHDDTRCYYCSIEL